MKISVFTPTHNPKYIMDCYNSLKSQTIQDWEWIIVYNNQGIVARNLREIQEDPRVKFLEIRHVKGVGEAKSLCCQYASGDILLELDHDDVLHPECLEEVLDAFQNNPEASVVYSNFAQINHDTTPNMDRFGNYGWTYRKFIYEGTEYQEVVSFKPSPQMLGYIWFLPNHVRAFRRTMYEKCGGYDMSMTILDDQDLLSRLYLEGDFVHVDRCLYFQRIHSHQTQKVLNPDIQTGTQQLYTKYIAQLAIKWSERNNLRAIDFGSAHNKPEGFEGLDVQDREGVDIVCDVNNGLPFADGSVGVIRASDFLEHIPDKVKIINEIYRVLAHGGILLSNTPSSDGRGAFQDPTHVAFYNRNSFWYYTKEFYRNFVAGLNVKFMESYTITHYPSQFHEDNNIPYIVANLIAVKEGIKLPGVFEFSE